MSVSTPVAFFIFNRPNLTKIVFEAIARSKPKKLLVVADGPRFPEETEKCHQARTVLEKIDWDCEVFTNFSETNMGCRQRVSSGLNWVFSEVEEAIILEDDCLPAPSFFHFCETLLDRYRQDERIMMISGDNFQSGKIRTPYSYYFSKYVHIWGWASWRRAWQYYDVDMKTWPEFKKLNFGRFVWEDSYEEKYWTDTLDRVFEGAIDTWDYQWAYACWRQSGLSILPKFNLVSNIGFGSDATHTSGESSCTALPTVDIWEIDRPPFLVRDLEADRYTFDYIVGGKLMRERDTLSYKFRQKISTFKRAIISKQ